MKYILLTVILILPMSTITLFNFSEDSNTMDWKIIDDVVMGGRSTGSFFISENGHGVFEGNVSLENNGGFSSIRYTNSFTIPKNQIYSMQELILIHKIKKLANRALLEKQDQIFKILNV